MTRSNVCLLPSAGLLCLACLCRIAHAADTGSAESLPAPASYELLIADLQAGARTPDVDARLSEAYAGLGNALQSLGLHEDAVEAFGNALQAIRENKGLFELEQLPVLQAQLDSHQALEAWRDVDAGKQLAHLISLKNPAAGLDRRYQTLRELGLWKLRAAEDDLLANPLSEARDAAALYRLELERPDARVAYAGRPLSVANLYLDLAALEFLQARKKLALPLSEYVTGGQRTTTQMYCETIQTPDGRGRQVCRSMQVPNLDYFMSLSDRKYKEIRYHLDAMKDAVLEAYDVLLAEVATQNRDDALTLLAEVRRLTDAHNDFSVANARRTGTRITAQTGSIIRH